jgi:hypothetical protein
VSRTGLMKWRQLQQQEMTHNRLAPAGAEPPASPAARFPCTLCNPAVSPAHFIFVFGESALIAAFLTFQPPWICDWPRGGHASTASCARFFSRWLAVYWVSLGPPPRTAGMVFCCRAAQQSSPRHHSQRTHILNLYAGGLVGVGVVAAGAVVAKRCAGCVAHRAVLSGAAAHETPRWRSAVPRTPIVLCAPTLAPQAPYRQEGGGRGGWRRGSRHPPNAGAP